MLERVGWAHRLASRMKKKEALSYLRTGALNSLEASTCILKRGVRNAFGKLRVLYACAVVAIGVDAIKAKAFHAARETTGNSDMLHYNNNIILYSTYRNTKQRQDAQHSANDGAQLHTHRARITKCMWKQRGWRPIEPNAGSVSV